MRGLVRVTLAVSQLLVGGCKMDNPEFGQDASAGGTANDGNSGKYDDGDPSTVTVTVGSADSGDTTRIDSTSASDDVDVGPDTLDGPTSDVETSAGETGTSNPANDPCASAIGVAGLVACWDFDAFNDTGQVALDRSGNDFDFVFPFPPALVPGFWGDALSTTAAPTGSANLMMSLPAAFEIEVWLSTNAPDEWTQSTPLVELGALGGEVFASIEAYPQGGSSAGFQFTINGVGVGSTLDPRQPFEGCVSLSFDDSGGMGWVVTGVGAAQTQLELPNRTAYPPALRLDIRPSIAGFIDGIRVWDHAVPPEIRCAPFPS